MDDPLGPLQGNYDAWTEVLDQVRAKPDEHFVRTIEVQFQEFYEHKDAGLHDKMLNEIIDILGVTINWLRQKGLDDVEIARRIRARTENRVAGQAQEILDKYERLYGI